MLTQQQIDALEAAVDIAYDGTPSDDAQRLEMEGYARAALATAKAALVRSTIARGSITPFTGPTLSSRMSQELRDNAVYAGRTLESDLLEDR